MCYPPTQTKGCVLFLNVASVFLFSLVRWTLTISCWLQGGKAFGVAGAKAAAEEAALNQRVESRVKKKKKKERLHKVRSCGWRVNITTRLFSFSCKDTGRSTTSTLNRFSALQQSGSLLSSSDSDRRVPQRYAAAADPFFVLSHFSL